MTYATAKKIAEKYQAMLSPFCLRCEIAGSVRRRKPVCGDIELVCIPRDDDFNLFVESSGRDQGFLSAVNSLHKIKGEPSGRYTQRLLPEEINGEQVKLDIFMTSEKGWGYIFAIRTGSDAFSKRLASQWSALGYRGNGDHLIEKSSGKPAFFKEEGDLFRFLQMDFVDPEKRY